MFVINDFGDAQKVSTIEDLRPIRKSHLRVFNDDGSMLFRKIHKTDLINKLDGNENMGLIKRMLGDTCKERSIAKKMQESTKQKAISSKATSLKKEFDLSDDEAEFMAKRATTREARAKKVSSLVSGISSGVSSLASALDPDLPPAAQLKPGKSKKSKKRSGSSKKQESKPFNPLDIDLPDFKL